MVILRPGCARNRDQSPHAVAEFGFSVVKGFPRRFNHWGSTSTAEDLVTHGLGPIRLHASACFDPALRRKGQALDRRGFPIFS